MCGGDGTHMGWQQERTSGAELGVSPYKWVKVFQEQK